MGNWSGHLPFVHDLIAALRPALLVELGVHRGDSYFGMCQTVQENGISCKCYGVDTWTGDAHAGFYDESVFDEVNEYNEENYPAFSRLLRSTFDEAQENFGNSTIDLLHIDGLHRYQAVRHDFDLWYPKVRPGGVVLLHDTAARQGDFQVWKLWEELTGEFPTLEFTHSWGLGILRKPGGLVGDSEFIDGIFSATPREKDVLRHYYRLQGELLKPQPSAQAAGQTLFKVYPASKGGYSEATAVQTPVKLGEWQHVVLELPQGSATGPIRSDPADRPCLIEIAGVLVKRGLDGTVLESWTDTKDIRTFSSISDLVPLPGSQALQFLSTSVDPQFSLPELDRAVADQPLVVDARVRIDENLTSALAQLQSAGARQTDDAVAIEEVTAARDAAQARVQQLSVEVQQLSAEVQQLSAEIVSLGSLASDREQLSVERAALRAELDVVYHSRSWRLTAPLRRLFRTIG